MSDATLSMLLALGGGLGACSRYAVGELFDGEVARRWALATLVVNGVGSLLLGAATAVMALPPGSMPDSVLIGFCGGFTTFSSFAWHTRQRYRHAGLVAAAANVMLNLSASLLAFALGLQLARVV